MKALCTSLKLPERKSTRSRGVVEWDIQGMFTWDDVVAPILKLPTFCG